MNAPVKLLQVRDSIGVSVATLYREESGKLVWTAINAGFKQLLMTITGDYQYTPDLPSFEEGLSWKLKAHRIETIWTRLIVPRSAPPDGGIY